MLNRYALTSLAVAASALAGCSDSTAPAPVAPAQLARHLDSLIVATLHTNSGDQEARLYILQNAEMGPANGASTVPLTVTTRSGASTWQGLVVKVVDTVSNPSGVDSTYVLFAYRDYAMTTFLLAQTSYSNGLELQPAIFVVSGSAAVSNGNAGTGTNTFTTLAGSSGCTGVSGLKENLTPENASCVLARFNAGVEWTLPDAQDATADFGTVTIAPQQFSGVLLGAVQQF